MRRLLATAAWAAIVLTTAGAPGEQVIHWPPRAGAATQPSDADRARAFALAREAVVMLENNDVPGAETRLRQAISIVPDKAVWRFNLACILTVERKLDAALDLLESATACGFTDFAVLQADPDLAPLHNMPRYQRLIARKAAITHQAALDALADLKSRFGDGYLYDVDEEQKLVFATNTDAQTLAALKTWLHDQAKSQAADLFEHTSDEFIRIVVPSLADYHKLIHQRTILGIYEDESRTLVAQRLGQVMTHEFTHALHAADQRAVGQEHPIWLREGVASLYEAADFEKGDLVPHDNFRLGFVQSAARRHALIPLAKLLRLSTRDFIAGPNLAYGQSSSLLLYLYEKNLLRKFYEEYKRTYRADATGEAALQSVTGQPLAELEQQWTRWMLARTPPATGPTLGGPTLGLRLDGAVDGLRVMMVIPQGPGFKAGIRPNDLLVAIDDREVRDYTSFAPLLNAHKPGEQVTLKLRREGKYIDVPVVLAAR